MSTAMPVRTKKRYKVDEADDIDITGPQTALGIQSGTISGTFSTKSLPTTSKVLQGLSPLENGDFHEALLLNIALAARR